MSTYYYDCEFLEGKQKESFPISLFRKETKPGIDLISIGLIAEDNEEYYAISKDFNLTEAWNRFEWKKQWVPLDKNNQVCKDVRVYWIRENVLLPIFYQLALDDFHLTHFKDQWLVDGKEVTLEVFKSNAKWSSDFKWFKKLIKKYGKTNDQIAAEIKEFIYKKEDVLYNHERCSMEDIGSVKSDINLYGYYSAYDHVVFCWLFGKMMNLPNGFPMYTRDLKQILDEITLDLPKELIRKLQCSICNHNSLEYLENTGEAFELEFRLKRIKKHADYPKQENEHNSLSDARWNKKLHEFLKSLQIQISGE